MFASTNICTTSAAAFFASGAVLVCSESIDFRVVEADVARANVVALHSFSDDEALMWLSDHLEGRVEMSLGDLAQQFGWPLIAVAPPARRLGRGRTHHAVRGRQGQGHPGAHAHVERSRHATGRAAPSASPPPASRAAEAARVPPVDRHHRRRAVPDRARIDRGRPGHECALCRLVRPDRGSGRCCSPRSGLRSTCSRWCCRASASSSGTGAPSWPPASAWTIWLAVLVMTLLAAMGFASTNIGDAVAGRARIASESGAADRTHRSAPA